MDAGENLDEGGFSGAVFSAQGVDFPLPYVEGHAVQRPDAREDLYNVLTLNDGFRFRQFGYLQSGLLGYLPKKALEIYGHYSTYYR